MTHTPARRAATVRERFPTDGALMTNVNCSCEERVDPALVPKRRLYSGALMPAIGLGTFGSDHAPPEEVAAAVKGAILAGCRHLDCASVYGNEDRIGAALDEVFHLGIRRQELWVTSKLRSEERRVGKECRS